MDPYKSPWGDVDESVYNIGRNVRPKISPSGFGRQTKIILTLVGIFAALALGVVYYLYFSGNQANALALTITTNPDKIYAGAPFTILIAVTNTSNQPVGDAGVSLTLPDNLSFVGKPVSQRSLEQTAGNLDAGQVNTQTFNVIATGGSNSAAHVTADATYSTQGSSSQFDVSAASDVFIGNPAVDVKLGTPQSIFNGKNFDLTVNYANNSGESFNNFAITLSYPSGYQFKTANVNPASNSANNLWTLGTLAPRQNGSITVTGALKGLEGSFYPVNATATAQISGTTYPLGAQNANIAIAYAPLSVGVALAGSSNPILAPGDPLQYVLTYKNNSNTTFEGVIITANLAGSFYDYTTLRSDAAFDSVNHVLHWFAANTPALGSVGPGESGTVTFTVSLLNNYPIVTAQDKNFIVKVDAQISSQTVPTGTAAGGTAATTTIQNKIKGNITFDAKGYWRDAAAGIVNHGPYPPKENVPTQYTVHWILKNYGVDAVNIHITAKLDSATTFTGTVKSNITTTPQYDPSTGIVTWNIPYLQANKGVLNTPPEAIFQIQNVPAANQIGFNVPLVDALELTAQDAWTLETLITTGASFDTSLPDDKTIPSTVNRLVQP